MTFENYVKAKLVAYAADEALRYGSTDCAFAVAQVIANRVRAGWQGGDWLKVLGDAPRFVGTRHPDIKDAFEIDPRSNVFRQLLSGIDDIYHGIADDGNVNVNDDRGPLVSLYYCELHHVTETWFYENILNKPDDHPRVAKVGELSFFA